MSSSNRMGGSSGSNGGSTRRSGSGGTAARIYAPLILFIAFAMFCVIRLVYLQVIVAEDYSSQAAKSRTVDISTTPRRGTIYDRNGVVLACSVDATTVYANPAEVTDAHNEAVQIAAILGGKVEDYESKLSTEGTSFVYVKRKADVDLAKQIKELKLPGIYFISDTRREYPYGAVGGQVIGFCGVDGNGLAGLELYYDEILSGTQGKLVTERGLGGTPIPGGVREEEPSIDGTDIMISLDIDMQSFVELTLVDWYDRWNTNTQSILMDSSTGEIIAAASLPLYNPSDLSVVPEGSTSVRGITMQYEPGSIFKAVTALALLENGVMTPDSAMFCPAELQADDATVTDAHDREDATFTFREIMRDSSNIGVSLSAELMGFDKLYDSIKKYNLCKKTGVDYPGEASGYLQNFEDWLKITCYNVSFGQGVSVTPLQMVRFYGAIINNGYERTPHFLIAYPETGEQVQYESTQICDNQQALDDLASMLETVVEDGTGVAGQIPGYHAAGKTGTAEVASERGGYKRGVYNISFVGFLNHSSSKLVCFSGVTELGAEGNVSGMFGDIMTYATDRYRIASE